MKGFIFIFSFVSSAFACEVYQGQTFCVGDKAIASELDGTIIGVSKTKISIDFTGGTTSKQGVQTFDIASVTLGKGCIDDVCVNEKGVGGNLEGEIVGVSPKRVSIKHKTKIKTYPKSDVLVRKGCVEAYCANDSAVFKSFDGTIVGINKEKKSVAISFVGGTSKYTGVGTYDLRTVAVAKGCVQGFCLGDRAVSGSVDGSVVGVNPYRNQVAVLGKISGRPVIVMGEASDVTMRLNSSSVSAQDKKRLIKTVSDFNQAFGN